MSLGFGSFLLNWLRTEQHKPLSPVIHSLQPTSHHAHHSEGLTPTASDTIGQCSILFPVEAPPRVRSRKPLAATPAELASHRSSHVVLHAHALTCLDVQEDEDQGEGLVVCAGADGVVRCYDRVLKVSSEETPHSGVSDVAIVQTSALSAFRTDSSPCPLFLSASSDLVLAHAYSAERRGYLAHKIAVPLCAPCDVALSVHASSRFFASASSSAFSLVDLHNLRVMRTTQLPTLPTLSPSPSPHPPPPVVVFHPSGRQLAVAGTGCALLYDVLAPPSAPAQSLHCGAPLTSCAFSPDGLHCALGSSDGSMRVLDLRMLPPPSDQAEAAERPHDFGAAEASVITVQAEQSRAEGQRSSAVRSLQFDDSAQYLFSAMGPDVVVYDATSWQALACWTEADDVSRIRVGRNARWWATTNHDGGLRFYSRPR